MRIVLSLAVALALVAACGLAHAEPSRYVIERPHSQIVFYASHEGFSMSQGEFLDFSGEFTFDPDNWGASSVVVTIRTGSLQFDDATWNEHMSSPMFFNVAAMPEARFRSTSLRQTGANTGVLQGELTLLGVTRPVTLDVTFNKEGVHSVSKMRLVGFSARGRLNRLDFGMAPMATTLPPEIELRIEVEGIHEDSLPKSGGR